MAKQSESDLLLKLNSWIWEAQWAAREWREESWRDSEMFDGGQASWTAKDYADAQEAGIDPITINRTFPTCNMLLGSQAVNRFDIVAKGRTQEDTELSNVMTEGIKFIFDQWEGEFIISDAFKDAVIPGFGCVSPCLNDDPRSERLSLKYRDWKEIWGDPFSPVWWHPSHTRYVTHQKWVDLEDFKALFPEQERKIDEAYAQMSGEWREHGYSSLQDEAQMVEEKIRMLSASDWVDTHRKRIRPAETWYPVNEMSLFALYADGRSYEIKKDMDPRAAFQAVEGSQQVVRAIVKKMRVATFFGESLLLQDRPTPYGHDQFPFVPFIGYVDRYGFPYGVPRQIRGQNEETNKRRSMALAMLQKRRVTVEKDAVAKGDADALDTLYEESNKIDGFMVLEPGGLKKFKIEDLAQLSQYQMQLMQQSELEIQEISGANAARLGYAQGDQSGVAKSIDVERSAVTTATLFDNLRRSLGLVGAQMISNIQSFWKYEKVLRVTDSLTGTERFITVNEAMDAGIETKNNVTQGKFDSVVSEAPASDTIREKNMDLLFAAIEKSPPEAVPTLLIAGFEMSDLPNKEILLEKLKPVLGIEPEDEDMTAEERKQKALEIIDANRQQQQIVSDIEMEGMKTQLAEAKLKNAKLEVEIADIVTGIEKTAAETEKIEVETEIAAEQHEIDAEVAQVDSFGKGVDISQKVNAEQPSA